MTSDRGRRLIVGTRASALALWQTHFIVQRLSALFDDLECQVRTFKTTGDDIVDRPLPELGGKGVFTARLEQALLGHDVDVAVHSLKDLPIEITPGLQLGAITSRADVRDVLITRDGSDFASLPNGARVGTSSLRRQAQLLRARPDLKIVPIRGNVETRVRKVREGEYDATVLAAAGLDRLGFGEEASDRFPLESMLPAPGQGALAVQCRADDRGTLELLAAINDTDVRRAALAERAFLASLGGGCAAPVGAIAEITANGDIHMRGVVARPDGTRSVFVEGSGGDGGALGAELARTAIAQGARAIIDDARVQLDGKLPLMGKRVVVTRAADQSRELCDGLAGCGAIPVHLPMIRTVPLASERVLAEVKQQTKPGDWLVFTSVNGVSAVWPYIDTQWLHDLKVAAVGPQTAAALAERAVTPDFVPVLFTGEEVARGMPDIADRGVWLLRAETAGEDIVRLLVKRGAKVHDIPVYRTEPEAIDESKLSDVKNGVDVITFTSGSTARSFWDACERNGVRVGRSVVIACIGPSTAKTARDLGFEVDVVADEHTTSGLIDVLIKHFNEGAQ